MRQTKGEELRKTIHKRLRDRLKSISLTMDDRGWTFHNGFWMIFIEQVGLHDFDIGLIERNKRFRYIKLRGSTFLMAKLCLVYVNYMVLGGISRDWDYSDFEPIFYIIERNRRVESLRRKNREDREGEKGFEVCHRFRRSSFQHYLLMMLTQSPMPAGQAVPNAVFERWSRWKPTVDLRVKSMSTRWPMWFYRSTMYPRKNKRR